MLLVVLDELGDLLDQLVLAQQRRLLAACVLLRVHRLRTAYHVRIQGTTVHHACGASGTHVGHVLAQIGGRALTNSPACGACLGSSLRSASSSALVSLAGRAAHWPREEVLLLHRSVRVCGRDAQVRRGSLRFAGHLRGLVGGRPLYVTALFLQLVL